MTIKGTVRGKAIELSSALLYPNGQEGTIQVIAANRAARGSPQALSEAIQKGPQVDPAIATEFERVLREGRLAVQYDGPFDADQRQ
jgi:hypothetical protein